MTVKLISWLPSVGLGFALGFVAARTDLSSLSGAVFSAEGGVVTSASRDESGDNSPCCSSRKYADLTEEPALTCPKYRTEASMAPESDSDSVPAESPDQEPDGLSPPSD